MKVYAYAHFDGVPAVEIRLTEHSERVALDLTDEKDGAVGVYLPNAQAVRALARRILAVLDQVEADARAAAREAEDLERRIKEDFRADLPPAAASTGAGVSALPLTHQTQELGPADAASALASIVSEGRS